jgi:hypothetical protein
MTGGMIEVIRDSSGRTLTRYWKAVERFALRRVRPRKSSGRFVLTA